jgi:putative Holliday junction resolvase
MVLPVDRRSLRLKSCPVNVLGIDFGEARIGIALAIGNTSHGQEASERRPGSFAVPLETLMRTTDRVAIARIVALARERDIEALVLGLPLGLDGQHNDACERVERFADKLARRARLPVHLVNEALTSHQAAERLRQAGPRSAQQAGALDAMSACILLQEWLDQQTESSSTAQITNQETSP